MKLETLKGLYYRTFDYLEFDFNKSDSILLFRKPNESYGHFVSFIIRNKNIYFFDSYGLNPIQILDSIKEDKIMYSKYENYFRSFNHCFFNDIKYQDEDAKTCGLYALLYVLFKKSINEFNKEFNGVIKGSNPDLKIIEIFNKAGLSDVIKDKKEQITNLFTKDISSDDDDLFDISGFGQVRTLDKEPVIVLDEPRTVFVEEKPLKKLKNKPFNFKQTLNKWIRVRYLYKSNKIKKEYFLNQTKKIINILNKDKKLLDTIFNKEELNNALNLFKTSNSKDDEYILKHFV